MTGLRQSELPLALLRGCILFLVSGAITGCGKSNREIAVIPRTTAFTIWEAEHAGAELAASRYGMHIYWNAPTNEDDFQQQAALIERIISAKYPSLILAPDQPLALMAPVQRALRHGIRTVVIGSPLPLAAGGDLFYIVNDDEASGRLAAMRIGKVLDGHGRVAVVGVNPESLSDLTILHAFETALEQNYPGIVIAKRRTGTHNATEAQRIVDEILSTDHDVHAIFCLSTSASDGAIAALSARNLTGKIKLVGFEQSAELANLIRLHQVDSIVAEDTYGMGYLAVQLLAHVQSQQSVPHERKIEPTLLTLDNINSPDIRNLVNTDWSNHP